jgi:cytochrome c553
LRKFLFGLALLAGGVVAIAVGALFWCHVITERRIAAVYPAPHVSIAIPTGEDAIARGAHLSAIFGCTECHGVAFEGRPVLEEPLVASIYAPNLTTGKGGVGAQRSDADFVRAIRHGIGDTGRSLWVMPSQQYYGISDDDVGAMVAFIRSRPAVDHVLPESRPGIMGRVLVAAGVIKEFLPAELVDHDAPRAPAPAPGPNAEYGRYLTAVCSGCHHSDFSGGPLSGIPDAPPAPNLTPAGRLSAWTRDDFATALRTGRTPDGRTLDQAWMPLSSLGQATDEEIDAMWLYLKSLPPVE